MKRKNILTIIVILSIIIVAMILRIIPIKKEVKQCPTYEDRLIDCNAEYNEPVCWEDKKTYDNSCIACYMYWQKYYTEWTCTKPEKINMVKLIINKLKN